MEMRRFRFFRTLASAASALLWTALWFAHPVSAQQADSGWPREFTTADGTSVVTFQPQLDDLQGNRLSGRAAVSVTLPNREAPLFGALWFESRIETDRDSREVAILDTRVTRVRFTEATDEQESALIALIEAEAPGWNLQMSLDRMLTALGVSEKRQQASEGLNNQPPQIYFRTEPTVLLVIEGEPILVEVEGSGLQAVVNTPAVVIHDPGSGTFYFFGDRDVWYSASSALGPWTHTRSVPSRVLQLAPEIEDDAEETEGPLPAIVAVTEPSELIVSEGRPEFAPLAGGELLFMTNTDSDVVVEIESQRHFVLLSGRWFAGPGMDGPWTFVAPDELPESFLAIEPDSEVAHLRAWVAGTEEAEEAVLDAQIPQTAVVRRDSTTEVTYDGDPRFEQIEGTRLAYAVNTPDQVLEHGGRYFVVDDGVWYESDSATGPWVVAVEVPEEIYNQPPSSPTYNTTYVQVFDATPEVVYVGYYPGYVHSFHHRGCMFWGTGWWHSPWWGGRYWWPRHSTWGFHMSWNPYWGWSFGTRWSAGWFSFSVSWGSSWGRSSGWWGPVGRPVPYSRGFNHGWAQGSRAGFRAGYRAGQRDQFRRDRNLYNRPRNAVRNAAPAAIAAGGAATMAAGRANNVFADQSGNIYRRNNDGTWQQRQGGDWTRAEVSNAAAGARDRAGGTQTRREPQTRTGDRQRANVQRNLDRSPNRSSLNRQHNARQRGTARTQNFRGGGGRAGGRRR